MLVPGADAGTQRWLQGPETSPEPISWPLPERGAFSVPFCFSAHVCTLLYAYTYWCLDARHQLGHLPCSAFMYCRPFRVAVATTSSIKLAQLTTRIQSLVLPQYHFQFGLFPNGTYNINMDSFDQKPRNKIEMQSRIKCQA